MNKMNSVHTQRRRVDGSILKVEITCLLLALSSMLPSVSQAQAVTNPPSPLSSANHGQAVTILDTLGTATPRTTFSVFGSAGMGIYSEAFVGPQFTLTRRSVLTTVGAFVNNCDQISAGVPQCPNTRPFVVQIRRSINGMPDPRLLIAAAPLSHDNDPLTVSFESASFNDIPLEAGTYFAIIAPQQAGDAGIILSSVLLPSGQRYVAGITVLGNVSPTGSTVEPAYHAAVKIIARPVTRRPRATSQE